MKALLGIRAARRLGYFASAAVLGLSIHTPADAQATDTRTSAAAGQATVAEVVVTARKRSETLQSVPLSISAISAQALQQAGIQTTEGLFGRIPSLYFTNSGGAGPTSDFIYLEMRGVGSNGGQEPAAGVFIDGMYVPQLGFDLNFVDAARVEVLRGPQGTLFGRNTEAGAINIVTQKPGDVFTARAEVSGGSFGDWSARATVSGPVAPSLYAGLDASYSDTSGYISDSITHGEGAWSHEDRLRGVLRWTPNDQWDIRLSADDDRKIGTEMGFGVPYECHCYTSQADQVVPGLKDNYGVQLNADWTISPHLTLTSITGDRSVFSNITLDYDGFPTAQIPQTFNGVAGGAFPGPYTESGFTQQSIISQRVFSQELRLTGSFGDVNTLAGLYYFGQNENQQRYFNGGQGIVTDPSLSFFSDGAIIREDYNDDRSGYAGFGQVSWRPISQLELTGGGRYSVESDSIDGARLRNIYAIEDADPTYFTRTGSKTFDNFSWSGSIAWHFTPDTQLYATVSRGWKAGGFNRYPTTADDVIPYNSEISTNYEVGLKSGWWNNRLIANLTAFYVDIQDQQLVTTILDNAGIPLSTIVNAGRSRSEGVEVELTARPVERLTLNGAFSYTDARYVKFLNCDAPNDCINEAGQPFQFTPAIEASASADYLLPLNATTSLDFYGEYRFIDSTLIPDASFVAALGEQLTVPSYSRVNLHVGVIHQQWKLTAIVDNVFNSYSYDNANYSPFRTEGPASLLVTPLPPRTFLVKLAYSY